MGGSNCSQQHPAVSTINMCPRAFNEDAKNLHCPDWNATNCVITFDNGTTETGKFSSYQDSTEKNKVNGVSVCSFDNNYTFVPMPASLSDSPVDDHELTQCTQLHKNAGTIQYSLVSDRGDKKSYALCAVPFST